MTPRLWHTPRFWFSLSGSFLALGLATAAIDPERRSHSVQEVVATLPTVTLAPAEPAATTGLKVVRERLQPGERLHELLGRLGVDDPQLVEDTLSSPEGRALQRRLLGNGTVTARLDDEGRVIALYLPLTRGERALIKRQEDNRFSVTTKESSGDTPYLELREGVITASLFATADEIGLPLEIASRLAEVFGTEIDFSRDLRIGDSFLVLYETRIDAMGETRVGDILAAEFINRGKRYQVLRYTDRTGQTAFYTPDGKVLGTGFLRYPLKFTRVSSTFGLRHHPVTGEYKNHQGVDLASPIGTPVLAASDGVVAFKGWREGYGNLVILRHRNGYETRYGHLSGFGTVAVGQRIRQGEVIGFVGATGMVTGPHLHYEVRIAGKPYNPQTVQLPAPEPLTGEALADFTQRSAATQALLASATRSAPLVTAAAAPNG